MSEATEVLKTQNQMHTDFNTSKIFIWGNRFEQHDFKNTSGGALTVPGGTLVGKVTSSNELYLLKSGSSDGSEIPVGIIAEESIDFTTGQTKQVNICIAGDVAEDKIVLNGTDTLATMIGGRSIRDRIKADTMGIKPVATDELTGFDNQ